MIPGLDQRDIKNLQEVKRNLLRIKETGTAPVNLIAYEKRYGLIKKRRITDSKGNLKDIKLFLTEKGKKIANVRL